MLKLSVHYIDVYLCMSWAFRLHIFVAMWFEVMAWYMGLEAIVWS